MTHAMHLTSQVGEVIGRFERKGFKLVGLKMHTPSRALAEEHYSDLSSKPFFKDLVNYIISGPVVCMVRHHKDSSMVMTACESFACRWSELQVHAALPSTRSPAQL